MQWVKLDQCARHLGGFPGATHAITRLTNGTFFHAASACFPPHRTVEGAIAAGSCSSRGKSLQPPGTMFHMQIPIARAQPRGQILLWLGWTAGVADGSICGKWNTGKDWQTAQVAKIATVLEDHPGADQYAHRYVMVLGWWACRMASRHRTNSRMRSHCLERPCEEDPRLDWRSAAC